MNHQQIKQPPNQNYFPSFHKQGQLQSRRKNISLQLENKSIERSPNNGKESKYLLTPKQACESPTIHKKCVTLADDKLIKQSLTMANFKNLISQSINQPIQSERRAVIGSPLSNKSSLTSRDNRNYLSININQTLATQVKSIQTTPHSTTVDVNKNSNKQNTPTSQRAQNSKKNPYQTFKFNTQEPPQNIQKTNFSQLVGVLDKNNNKQAKEQEISQIPIEFDTIQQQQSLEYIDNSNSKFSQNISQQNLTLSATPVSTQPNNNNISQINLIGQTFFEQKQENQNKLIQNNKNGSLYENNPQQPISLEQARLQIQQPNQIPIDGVAMIESQNEYNPYKNTSQNIKNHLANISNQNQNYQINSLLNKNDVQDQKDSITDQYRKSTSREQNIQNKFLNNFLGRKQSSPNPSQTDQMYISQSQKIDNKYPDLTNSGATKDLSINFNTKNSQGQIQNLGKINLNNSIQNQGEEKKNSILTSYLGIKNANIKLSSMNNSQQMNNSISQVYHIGLQDQLLKSPQKISQQFPGNYKHPVREESLTAFQTPLQKYWSKQSSSYTFVDIEESLQSNQAKQSSQKLYTEQLYTSPARDKSPRALIGKQSLSNVYDHSFSLKQFNKRFTEIYPHQKQSLSPNKSLFQIAKLTNQSQSDTTPSSMLNSSQKDDKKNKRNINYFNQPSDASGNIKTFLRFRPNNHMELDLNEQGIGQNVINFIDDYSVSLIGDQQQVYTVDKIFKPNDSQEALYLKVGEEVIYQVFLGYNGTIFTYGVTGSGKTHTMFGNITDSVQKGIIPRICNQIFDLVENDEEGVEFIINCSMLEIYKEILYDSFQEGKIELKIKESAQKGIYVQGLTQTSIANQDELFQLISIGYNTKRTRETRLNEYSSRSHTIFMIEIQQRLSNGDEKIGKINLIDLAGAEKASRSGAQGESLEEAIKINLSLSCLGKVIHALTSGNEYIPYRDSKLTRILQESLGGNYKTSLIVTCSMHSSFQDDTVSSLKFATRAKTVKNTYKMNIKLNPINLQKELENLKTQTESYKYIFNNVRTILNDTQNKIQCLPNISSDPKLYEIKNKLDEILTLQIAIDNMNTGTKDQNQPNGGVADNKHISALLDSKKEAQIIVKDETIKQLMQTNSDLNEQIQSLQQENQALKKENLNLTVKFNELSQEKNQIKLQLNKQLSKNDYSNFSLGILQKQIQHLVDSVCGAEKRISSILLEKKQVVDIKFEDYLKEKLSFSEIVLADYFKNSINFNFERAEKGFKDVQENVKKFNLEGDDDFMAEKTLGIKNSCFLIDSEVEQINSSNVSSQATFNQINTNKNIALTQQKFQSKNNSTSSFTCNLDLKINQNENNEILKKIFAMPSKLDMAQVSETVYNDFIIVSLKKQLIDSHTLNQSLLRIVNALEWKQIIEYGQSKQKSDQIQIQKRQIKHLENVLEEVTENHKELRLKIEDLEFDIYQQDSQQKSKELSVLDNKKQNKIIIPLTNSNFYRQQLLQKNNKRSNFVSGIQSYNFSKDPFSNISTIQKNIIDIQQSFKEMELDIIPLTYENALDELKRRNIILKRIRQINTTDLDSQDTQGINLCQKETEEFIKNERERLNNKIIILQQELKMEQVKVESIKHSLLVERKNVKDLKKLTESMEVSLRNTLKEEHDCWIQTINEITELNKIEFTKRSAEYSQLREAFSNIIDSSLQKIQEMKGKCFSQEVQQFENIIIEMEQAKLQMGKCYVNSIKKISINSSMQYINPQTQRTSIISNYKHS
ncbi:kinesin motor catalytic domain protein (macronuclear) [Tetrahymena thermophila SB210]|uniref:Kinesin motor catalytic domain protein n=1 Tax=Tetrahymena thermophila (strain SB210) TaxID=312017 RepID=I7MIN1_TETTS|nr:kinesin motor catalytic domain protein [Tetrahymena thermophila SB210]EAR93870.2 kinesin motor catalytic domain protein [Tetrahymena thermophila SB210]|eukprot:XP_001014115.2 kinesin motor catalytic domain protein [Tetrahymena thermophila SB210]